MTHLLPLLDLAIPPGVPPAVSVVVPVKNEAANVIPLLEEIHAALEPLCPFEVIYVDDGSDDTTPAVLAEAAGRFARLRRLRHATSCGQSAAVRSGVLAARGGIICTLDGDCQNPPSELPRLLAPLLAADASPALGIVAGQRVKRQDTAWKKLASRLGNGIRGWLLQDGVRDTGCGLKAFRRDAFLMLPFFDHIHRYLPALMKREGFEIALVDVSHRARGAGTSKYGNLDRALVGITDLIGVRWLIRRRRHTVDIREL